jgi:hypothetical protein
MFFPKFVPEFIHSQAHTLAHWLLNRNNQRRKLTSGVTIFGAMYRTGYIPLATNRR